MEEYLAYINGAFVKTEKTTPVIDPATEEEIARVPFCTEKEVDEAVDAAFEAQKLWRKKTAVERAALLRAWAAKIYEHQEELGRLLSMEEGKPLNQAVGETGGAAELIEYHAEWARRIEGDIIQSDDPHENVWIYKEPLGVVGCIIPWNFPIYIFARKVAPALMAGNTVVVKPSGETPLTSLVLARLMDEAGFPAGVVNVITGPGAVIGQYLSSHKKVAMVSLTGSTEAGQSVMRGCADNVSKVSLELGGKAPSVVMKDADLDLAVSTIVAAKAKNAGQVCTSPERIYVQKDVADEFIGKLSEAFGALTYGIGLDNPSYGTVINAAAVDRIQAMVERAVEDGAKLLIGGKKPEGKGAFYPPTILTDCRQDMEIMREEIFGPVLPVMVFDTPEEALDLTNDCKYGLTAVLYTNDLKIMMKFANEVECGELFVNRAQGEAYNGYHSGWKQTGIGGDDGRYGLDEFLQTRTVYCVF